MAKSTRNPILNVDYYDIENNLQTCRVQLIGDPHFGKTFKTGVPSSKISIIFSSQAVEQGFSIHSKHFVKKRFISLK